jgi:hypothetical protein
VVSGAGRLPSEFICTAPKRAVAYLNFGIVMAFQFGSQSEF